MLERTGIPINDDLKKIMPDENRMAKGPVVVIECFQKIPCDPCAASCKFGAIKPFDDINDLPVIDFDKCTGCGICIGECPGLAIFVVDNTFSDEEALIKLPYEMLPIPEKGDIVHALDRAGNTLCQAKVKQVIKTKNQTNIISIIVPKELSMKIRNIKVEGREIK